MKRASRRAMFRLWTLLEVRRKGHYVNEDSIRSLASSVLISISEQEPDLYPVIFPAFEKIHEELWGAR